MEKMKLTENWERIYDDDILDFIIDRTSGLDFLMELSWDSNFCVWVKNEPEADQGCFWLSWGWDYRKDETLVHMKNEDWNKIFSIGFFCEGNETFDGWSTEEIHGYYGVSTRDFV